jgi:hypothetical protein
MWLHRDFSFPSRRNDAILFTPSLALPGQHPAAGWHGRHRPLPPPAALLGKLDLLLERHEPQLGSALPGCSGSSRGGVLVVCCGAAVLVERVVLVVTTASTTPAGWRLRPQPRRPCTGGDAW